jgi:hypothetical protein
MFDGPAGFDRLSVVIPSVYAERSADPKAVFVPVASEEQELRGGDGSSTDYYHKRLQYATRLVEPLGKHNSSYDIRKITALGITPVLPDELAIALELDQLDGDAKLPVIRRIGQHLRDRALFVKQSPLTYDSTRAKPEAEGVEYETALSNVLAHGSAELKSHLPRTTFINVTAEFLSIMAQNGIAAVKARPEWMVHVPLFQPRAKGEMPSARYRSALAAMLHRTYALRTKAELMKHSDAVVSDLKEKKEQGKKRSHIHDALFAASRGAIKPDMSDEAMKQVVLAAADTIDLDELNYTDSTKTTLKIPLLQLLDLLVLLDSQCCNSTSVFDMYHSSEREDQMQSWLWLACYPLQTSVLCPAVEVSFSCDVHVTGYLPS